MPISRREVKVIDSLSIVTVTGYEPETEEVEGWKVTSPQIDPPGSANWLVEQYGMAEEDGEPSGILWTDYDSPDLRRFTVLIAGDEAEGFGEMAREAGYVLTSIDEVTEPMVYGDSVDTCLILKHPDGWVILP